MGERQVCPACRKPDCRHFECRAGKPPVTVNMPTVTVWLDDDGNLRTSSAGPSEVAERCAGCGGKPTRTCHCGARLCQDCRHAEPGDPLIRQKHGPLKREAEVREMEHG